MPLSPCLYGTEGTGTFPWFPISPVHLAFAACSPAHAAASDGTQGSACGAPPIPLRCISPSRDDAAVCIGSVQIITSTTPAYADGPAPCSSGPPPFADAGFCATYSGFNTFYGTYGPGFPTVQGFGLCAEPPASGGDYPAPNYNYVAGAAPLGASGDWNALGFALSEGQASGYLSGVAGQFTADQAAAAAKLLFDTVVWGTPVPSMDPGLAPAYGAFAQWYNQALGMSASPPQLSVSLVGGGTSFTTSATDEIHLQFPGTNAPLVGQPLLLTINNGTFNTPGGPTSIGVTTDAGGNVIASIFVDGTGSGPVSVTVSTSVGVGQPGIGFYHPTTGNLSAQTLAEFAAPTALSATQSLQGTPQAALPSGTVSVQKAGDDARRTTPLAGAVFQVLQAGTVVATLTTDASGSTAPSGKLNTGAAMVHELTAPPGYQLAPDQSVIVGDGTNTVVDFTGANEDHITPSTVSIAKVDAQGSAPLAGAVFDVKYSSADNGIYDEDLGTCTTAVSGQCSPSGNDGADLLPGDYQITETVAPLGYSLNSTSAVQTLTLTPGEAGTATFADFLLGSINLSKTGNDTAYYSVAGAVFAVTGPSPSREVPQWATFTVTINRTCPARSRVFSPAATSVTETTAPAGYTAIAPVSVNVATGHTTTTVDVLDSVQAATVTLFKVDAQTQAPLAGAVMRR